MPARTTTRRQSSDGPYASHEASPVPNATSVCARSPGWSVAIGDPGTKLGRDPDLLRGPDVALTRIERRPTGSGAAGWLEGAPEIVVEVAGDRPAPSALAAKALEYLAAGACLVWIVDPEPRRVMEFTPPDRVRILGPSDALEGGTILPGFRCEVAALFA